MRHRSSIVIRSEDHFGDPVGVIFLLEPEQLGDTVIEKLRDYFGGKIQVLKAVVSRDKIEVDLESPNLREESDRLVEAAAGLVKNRLYRSAESMLENAIQIDPLNPRASLALGEVYQAREKYPEAIAMLVRSREASGTDTPELLATLGTCCLKAERTAAAIKYLERAVILDPRHFSARRWLLALVRKPEIPATEREPAKPSRRRPQVKR